MNPQQVARAGEMFVAAEIHRRGGYAVTFAGNMPGIDILVSDLADTRRIPIQVKAKSSGSWHARFPKEAAECSEDPAKTSLRERARPSPRKHTSWNPNPAGRTMA